MPRRIIAAASAAALAISLSTGIVLAGQPNQSCQAQLLAPAGFSTAGFAHAETVYAGSGPGSLHANSGNAVSQYDVACFQVSLHH